MEKNKKLVLENGKIFEGIGFGSNEEVVNDLVFNTNVVGYQEVISDPKNIKKIMCMTYPVIGNYGLNDEDFESNGITISGLVVREYNDVPSNFRFTYTLSEAMNESNVSGICGVDTREIARILREEGNMKAIICDIDKPIEQCLDIINNFNEQEKLINYVSSKKVWYSRTTNPLYTVVAIDCGIKKSLVKVLNAIGCNVVIVPYTLTKEQILSYKPNGIVISDGPGNPNECQEVIDLVNNLKGSIPILGIGYGKHIIEIAYGAKVNKLKVGKNGSNYPVKDTRSGKIEITSQNNLYCLEEKTLSETELKVFLRNVLDNSVNGVIDRSNNIIGISYDLSISGCKQDNQLSRFLDMMKKFGRNK